MHGHLLPVNSFNVHDHPLVFSVAEHADMTVSASCCQLNKGWVESQTIYRTYTQQHIGKNGLNLNKILTQSVPQ